MAHNVLPLSDLFDFVSTGLGHDFEAACDRQFEVALSRAFGVLFSNFLAFFSVFLYFIFKMISKLYNDTFFTYLH